MLTDMIPNMIPNILPSSSEISRTLNTGDPLIRTWFLVRNDYLPLILCASYAIFATKLGPYLMRNREPLVLRKTMVVFNLVIVAAYLYSTTYILSHLHLLTHKTFCLSGQVVKGDITYKLTSMCWVIYVLKYVEFGDTVFFILRKKNHLITNLHVIHHTLVPMFGWIMMRTESTGFQSIPVLINAVVHIIMYTYYGLAAIGPSMRKYLWWKKYLTLFQMVQFVLIFLFITVVTPLTGCKVMKASILVDIFATPMFFILFYNFYKHTFGGKSVKTS